VKPSEAVLSVMLALALLAASVPSHGQQPAKVYRIGWLGTAPPAVTDTTPQRCPITGTPNWQAWMAGLREHGYIPGQNLVIECRFTEGRAAPPPALAAELMNLKPDLILANTTANVLAAKQASSTIPIVMMGVMDPVGRGVVASLAHPGGNVTGPTDDVGPSLAGKYLELLKEAIPRVSRVAVLVHRPNPLEPPSAYLSETQAAARALDVTPQTYRVQAPGEIDGAFTAMIQARAEALVVLPHPSFSLHAQRIVALAAQSRLPAMYFQKAHVEAGGLMAYAPDRVAIWRRLGYYVDKILKGANPGDLPVEQPTKFELIINLKAARAFGLTIPQSLLMRADEVIE
jgi:putative ABC transport system substrate-binding protein